MALEIQIKYFDSKYHTSTMPRLTRLEKLDIGNWIDLRAAERTALTANKYIVVPLGIAMKLPAGYEAIIAPRSSSFKTWGALQVNGIGIIDETYCGDEDEWKWAIWCTRDDVIMKGDRVCQFRIQKVQPDILFAEVDKLGESRGGFGSTGIK